jgi:hypothetical protein
MINKKIVETKTVSNTTESVTCDLCGAVFTHAKEIVGGIDWDQFGNTAHTGVYIGRRSESDDAKLAYRHYHICPECFEKSLEPWLRLLNVAPTLDEIFW